MSETEAVEKTQGEVELDALEGEYIAADAEAPGQAQPEAEAQGVEQKQMLAALLHLTLSAVAPAWEVQEGECAALAESYDAVIQKYWPGGLKIGPEFTAVAVTLAVFGPRWKKPRRKDDASEEATAA